MLQRSSAEGTVTNDRLRIVFMTHVPPSPASFGAQRRVEGLMSALAGENDVIAVSLVSRDMDARTCERAMREYCTDVVLVPTPPWHGATKRALQLRALGSTRSFESRWYDVPELRRTVRRMLNSRPVDVVQVESLYPYGAWLGVIPPGPRAPLRVLDAHNIEFDLARQQARSVQGMARRIHNLANWPKIQREELRAFRTFDGVTFCSELDEARASQLVPGLRSEVVPNSVDVDRFKPRPEDPPSDGRTVMFFGAINYFPNIDGLRYLFREVWPIVERKHPDARLKIVGQHPTPEVLGFRGPRVEVTGRVDDLRPHLASAALTIVPLRIGGGTRFKIVEAMAMARPVVSTGVGAEGIDAKPGRDILIGNDAAALAEAIVRVLEQPALGASLGARGRALVEAHYSWASAARRCESFWRDLLESQPSATA
jgi:glycosyltransferase involved in cell wall biosynthesis